MKQSELATELGNIKTQLAKVGTEVLGKLAALETALANQENVTPEVEAALAELKTSVSAIDGLIPDAPTEEPTV